MAETTLRKHIKLCLGKIENLKARNRIQAKTVDQLQLEFVRFVLTGNPSKYLKKYMEKHRSLKKAVTFLDDYLNCESCLPGALYLHYVFCEAVETSKERFGIKDSDWNYVHSLASNSTQLVSDVVRLNSAEECEWYPEIEAKYAHVKVYIDHHALEDLLVSTLECYQVRNKKDPYTEVYGLCFGMVQTEIFSENQTCSVKNKVISISKVVPQIRARGSAESVLPNDESTRAMLHTGKCLFPHLEVVSEFHSHPYQTATELYKIPGWQFSDGDVEYSQRQRSFWKSLGQLPQIELIVAIAKGHKTDPRRKELPPNTTGLRIGPYHIVLAAHRVGVDSNLHSNNISLYCGPTLSRTIYNWD